MTCRAISPVARASRSISLADQLAAPAARISRPDCQYTRGALACRNAELLAKLEKSKPFLNLRSMLTKKNVIVRDLREALKASGVAYADDVAATEE